MVQTYDPANLHEAPIYVGHVSDYPDSRAPSYGWIGKVFRAGDHLKVVASEFADELKDMIRKGMYKKVSAAFYKPDTPGNPTPGKWHLHHLAFLGAVPPAVKGLEAVQLSEFDEAKGIVLEFASYNLKDAAELSAQDTYEEIQEAFARTLTLIEGILTSDDIEEDDAAMAASNALNAAYCDAMEAVRDHFTFTEKAESILQGLKSKTAEMADKAKDMLAGMLLHLKTKPIHESKSHTEEIPDMGATTQEQDAKVLELSEKIKTLEAEKKALADKQAADAAKAADDRIRADVASFMDSLKTKGYPTKKLEELHVSDMLFQLAKANATVEYGEKKEQKPIAELFKSLLGDLPKPVEGEIPELAKDLVEYAAQKKLSGKMKQRDVQILQFAEKYAADHKDEFKGLDERQATAQAISRVMLGTIKMAE